MCDLERVLIFWKQALMHRLGYQDIVGVHRRRSLGNREYLPATIVARQELIKEINTYYIYEHLESPLRS